MAESNIELTPSYDDGGCFNHLVPTWEIACCRLLTYDLLGFIKMGSGRNICDDKRPGLNVVDGKGQLRHGEERHSKAQVCYVPPQMN